MSGPGKLNPTGPHVVSIASEAETLVIGSWPHDSLAVARQEVAASMDELPDDCLVRDLLLDREEPASACVQRLLEPPEVSNAFSMRQVEWNGLSFIRLVGLAQFGESDVLVEYEEDVHEGQVFELLSHVATYRLITRQGLRPGDPIPYGYWLLSIASESLYPGFDAGADPVGSGTLVSDHELVLPPPNFIIEAKDPTRMGEDNWVVGASQAMRVLASQRRMHRRIAEALGSEAPDCEPAFAEDPALLCSNLPVETHFFGYRTPLQRGNDSGWQFGCHDPKHVHDASSMVFGSLSHLALRDPSLIQYLALPSGWAFAKDQDGYWFKPPDEDRNYQDTGHEAHAPWLPVPDRGLSR